VSFFGSPGCGAGLMRRVIAYTLLCGYEPFRGDDEKQVAWKIQNGKAGYEHTFWRKISPEGEFSSNDTRCER